MLKKHEKFYTAHGKRLILIADDEEINQQLLALNLEEEYELLFASDGAEALRLVHQHLNTLSLVLLDLMMPVLDGREVLRQLREDPDTQKVPVIVLTSEQEAEVESLSLGAVDFIPKPYPQKDVILARVLRTIELFEDRQLIISTESDPLTGLYNKDFFYRYAEQYDRYHPDTRMDAAVLDVYHFHTINDRFGIAYGNQVLQALGTRIQEVCQRLEGFGGRREADTFLLYFPHRDDYAAVLEEISGSVSEEAFAGCRVRLRMGVYADADKELNVLRRFDRADMAADLIRTNATRSIEIYDDQIREKELFAERLIGDFHTALQQKQFVVFYQPKFYIQPETPRLSSAEALIRWKHPELGMVSPGVFIPLFEENGLIHELDRYVWRAACEQMRSWKEKIGFSVPVSVNVSRIDLYDPNLPDELTALVKENELSPAELLLEVTESAYTQDSDQLITRVNALQDRGFHIEMDDFGSGYSSLNMLSLLPIDTLKMDMVFIRTAFEKGKGTRLIEVIIDIARALGVPVVAEGVETREQMLALREIGCDVVQGYYFSKPVPPEQFETFLAAASAV